MGALPKRKTAKGRQRRRRSHLALRTPKLVACPQCHALRPSHQVCPACGTYHGRPVIEVKSPKRRER